MNLPQLPECHFADLSAELSMLVLATTLGLAQLVAAARAGNRQRGLKWNVGPRDEEAPPIGKIAGRLERARRNFMETYPFFVALILIGAIIGRHNWATLAGAELYVLGRLVYVPLYAFGVPVLRTLVWLAASIGILIVLAGLATPQLFA
jgi:uncharacterized MAPEG superfamily protein